MKRWRSLTLPLVGVLAMLGLSPPAAATHNADQHFKMEKVFESLNPRTNSDIAFWGNYAVHGYYTGDAVSQGGVRFFDISNPESPVLLRDFACDGPQNDPILWDSNDNGVPDLLLLAVDRTMVAPNCGAARSPTANQGLVNGWEGVRVLTLSDDPANPFATINQVAAVYTDCGAHTITLWPREVEDESSPYEGSLLVYVSSYPLRAGPTCGDTEFTQPNIFDGDPFSPADPLHGVIQVIEVPLASPATAAEIAQLPISYPGDPDGRIEWGERNPGLVPPAFEPGAVACHDIVVDVPTGLAAGACAEQGQVWEIDANGLPDTASPISISDDEVTSGGTGEIPGAIDFFHSAMFNNDATVAQWVDESFGAGCPTMTTYQPRPWNPGGGTHKTGRIFFTDAGSGDHLSEFHVGDLRPDASPGSYCSAHMGMTVLGSNRDLLVNAWYTGGVDVIDFSRPDRLKEVAYYDIANVAGNAGNGSNNWSAYAYTGPSFPTGAGIPVYATDGLGGAFGRGLVVFRTILSNPGAATLDHLNPQTLD